MEEEKPEETLTTLPSPDEETLVDDNGEGEYNEGDPETTQGYNKVKFHSAKMDLSLKILKEELVGLKHSGDSLSRKVATMFRTFNEMKDSGALSDVSDVEFEYESDEDSQTTNPSSAGSLEDDEDYLLGDRSRELRRESCPANSLDSGYYSRASDSSYGRPMRPGTLFISPPISGEEDADISGEELHTSSEDDNEISHHSRCSCCPPSPTNSVSSAGSFCSSRSSSTSSLSDSDSDDEAGQQNDVDVMGTQSSEGTQSAGNAAMRQSQEKNEKSSPGGKGGKPDAGSQPWRPRRLSPVYEQSQGAHDTGSSPFIPTLVFKRSDDADGHRDEDEEVEMEKVHLSTIEESNDEVPSPVDSVLSERRSPDGSADDDVLSDAFEKESVMTEIEVDVVSDGKESETDEERKSVQQLTAAFQKMGGAAATGSVKKQTQITEKRDVQQERESHKGKSSTVEKSSGSTSKEKEDRTPSAAKGKRSEKPKLAEERKEEKDKSKESESNQETGEDSDEKALPVSERRKMFDHKTALSGDSQGVKKHNSKKHSCPLHGHHHSKDRAGEKRKETPEKTDNSNKKEAGIVKSTAPQNHAGKRETIESRYQEVDEPDRETLAAQVRELKNWWKNQQGKTGDDKRTQESGSTKSRLLDELSRSRNFTPSAEFLSKNEDLIAVQPVYSRIQYGKPGSKPKRVLVIPSTTTPSDDEASNDRYVLMSPVLSNKRRPQGKEAKNAERSLSVDAGYKLMGPVRGSTKPSRPEITSKIRQRKTREPCRVANIVSPDEQPERVVCMQPVHSQIYRRDQSLPPDMRLDSDNPAFESLSKRPDIERRWSFTPEEHHSKDHVSQKRRHCVGSDPYATRSTTETTKTAAPKQKASMEPHKSSSSAKIVLSAKPDKVRGLFKELQQMDEPSETQKGESAPMTPPKNTQYGNFVFVKENRVKQMPDGTTKDSKCLKIVVKSKKKPNEKSETETQEEPKKAIEKQEAGSTENKRVTSTFTTEIAGVRSPTSTNIPIITRDIPIITRDIPIFSRNVPMFARDIPMMYGDIPVITSGDTSTFSFDIPMITRSLSTTSREIPVVVNRQTSRTSPAGTVRQQSSETHTTSYQTRIENPGGGNVIVIRRQKTFEPRESRVIANFQIEVPRGQSVQRHFLHQDTSASRPSMQQLEGSRVKSTYKYTFGST
ncbi:biorientation of chromosomes in cell division protein 1-like 1 [Ptychodera flava]|uniref:biorientation of chromosomes in cell division protein 1-like 1 n=1 Tax=Ptychodera flava TaxID=63121 RepID=UPI003969DFEE